MKKILCLIILFVLILSCQQPDVIKNYYIENGVKEFVNVQVFPIVNVTKSEIQDNPVIDFSNGVMYDKNSKDYDSQIHTLNLSHLTGGKQALVYLEVMVVDHGINNITGLPDDSAGAFYFREKNGLAQWQAGYPRFNSNVYGMIVLSDKTGNIEWYHDHTVPFCANCDICDPGFEIYKWEKITITAKWLVVGITL